MARGRLNQPPVTSELGAIPVMPTLRRWGAFRKFESRLEHTYGRDCAEAMLLSSYGVSGFTPIAGFPATLHDGYLVPRISGGGFADVADIRSRALGGWGQTFRLDKTGNAVGTAGDARQLWSKPGWPPTGATPIGGGSAPGSDFANPTTGGLNQVEPAGLTLYFLGAQAATSATASCLVMFDYFWGYNAPWNRGTTHITPNAPTKYQTLAGSAGVWGGTKTTTVLDGTATTITIQYTDQGGTNRTLSTLAVNTTAAVHEPIFPTSATSWTLPITQPGIRAIVDSVMSANPVSGAFDYMLGKNVVCIPLAVDSLSANGSLFTFLDGWQSVFNLAPIPTTANLAFMEFSKRGSGGVGGNVNIENLTLVAA